ncbi:hypothetical protein KIPB_014212 [Kipferlia bialata]|uniref:Uncharacterized protein n=1 Tax=Kipferlia bialata TaxID=797122 RepID=A0A391NTI3_9EUKA|nr:hypothetical protein KIPB_014212 [Kipferlia bialata]|eukprot:g14212.t1
MKTCTWLSRVFAFITAVMCMVLVWAWHAEVPTGSIPSVEQDQTVDLPPDLYDYRYCEMLAAFRRGLNVYVSIHSTLGLNECPSDLWDDIDTGALAEEVEAAMMISNGPRFWVVNGVEGEEGEEQRVVEFGGLQMAEVGSIEMKLWEADVDAYEEKVIDRTCVFVFYAGATVYDITSPSGTVYRMLSYSHLVDRGLSATDLATLGDDLDLPVGWTYGVSVLTEECRVGGGLSEAVTIQDTYLNTYQEI